MSIHELTADDSLIEAGIPMTAAQRGIYYAQQMDPDVPMSVVAFAEFGDRVDPDIMREAIDATCVETESALLTLVDTDDGEPLVAVDRSRSVQLGLRDFSDADDPRAAALAWIDEHRSKQTDLYSDPLLETYLLTLGPRHVIWYCWGHHLAFDGWAAMYMMLRVAAHYTAMSNGVPTPPAESATTAEIAALDTEFRASERFTAARDHWRERLVDASGDTPEFTSLSNRSAEAAPLATVRSAVLDDDLVARIRGLARAHRVRPASVLTAAVALYLARLNDRDEAMLSLPVACRDSDVLRTSAGLTSNVLPIRVAIGAPDDAPVTVTDLLRATNDDIKSAIRHQRYRHEDITADVFGAANGRRGFFGPMVNVMLFFEHIDFGPLRGELNVLSTGPVEDASINVYDSFSGGMRLDLEANPNIYPDWEIAAHHERIIDFLTRFIDADPEQSVDDLPLLTTAERPGIAAATAGPVTPTDDATLVDLLDAAATDHGDATGVVDAESGAALSYTEFTERAERVAAALRARGVGPESVVGVALPRSADQVVALHAVIRAGGAFLPIDPAEPADRRDHIIATARPDLIITEAGTDIDGDGDRRVATATLATLRDEAGSPDHVRAEAIRPGPDHPAYVLFTSGSTGRPKGVVITHRAIVNRLRWMQSAYPIGGEDRVLQKTPATFDVSVWEFFWPLLTGASLVVPTPDGHRDPWYLRGVIAGHGVTTVHFVPSMLAAFADVLDPAGTPDEGAGSVGEDLRSLRRIFTSGEALTPATVAAAGRLTPAPIHNLYGPTEAAIDVTHHDDASADALVIPIGRPVANTTVHVLDHRLAPQPVGAVGELYLGGVQLARGYARRADLTAARFVAHPDGSGERLYRTGDLARWTAAGELEYLGRSDTQVKIRGQRVELGEIESALSRLPGVRAAGVVLRDDVVAGELVVVGYVGGDRDLPSRDLRGELVDALPAHMIPTSIVALDDLPTTPSGKLDRRALPAPAASADAAAHVAPRDRVEQVVADTVAAVLGDAGNPVSMTATFAALGGNSLSATRVAARLSRATGTKVGIRAIFDAVDIAGIAGALRALGVTDESVAEHAAPNSGAPLAGTAEQDATASGTTASGTADHVPLSPAQHRLWVMNRMEPDLAAAYHMPFTVRLVGDLDIDALRAALVDVVARHEPLHSRIGDRDGTPVIVADGDAADVALPVVDRAGDEGTHVPSDLEFASAPFDLATEVPIRARLVRTGPNDHRLTMVIHHIAADGWSLGPLAADLATAYRDRCDGREPSWEPLPSTYSRVAATRNTWLADDAATAGDLEFWTHTLAGAPAETELPSDRRRPQRPDGAGAVVHAQLPVARHRDMLVLAAAHDATPFMVVHAAVAALLRTLSRSSDIVVGTPVSGRGDAEVDPLIGMFVNTLALRTHITKDSSFAGLLDTVRNIDLDAFEHADLPFDRLVSELNPQRARGMHPLFQVSVALEDNSAISLDFAGLSATASRIDTGHTKFDLQFTFTETRDEAGAPAGMTVEIGYATALFDRATVIGLAARLRRLIEGVLADPALPIGDIAVLDPAERLDLVPALGTAGRPVEHLSHILAGAVDAEPDRVAVADDTGALTYRELDAAADRLARRLVALGAGPERYVAIALPRSVDWIVAVWAVVRTGAAWVPVDPTYPAQRIAFMLGDSRACLLITTTAAAATVAGTDTAPPLVLIDDADAGEDVAGADAPALPEPASLAVDQPAYLIYTSGTTGTPKGVVVSHRGLADFAAQQVTQFGLHPESRTLHMASPSFDASVLEMLMAVAAAATMHIVPPGLVGGRELAELMNARRITHAFLTPSLLTTMAPEDVPALQALVIGGEHPNPEVVRRWSAKMALFNAYGPTETTVVATISDEIAPEDTVTIGRPIRGIAAMVLDERLRPVVPGAVGELYIAGPHLARGYHGIRPLTSKRFVANPYGERGDRMYRTGDLVRWTPDRELEFFGRADHQAKVRGHRIELGEIDAALTADDTVVAAVTVVHGEGERARLVSYVTLTDTQTDADSARTVAAIRDRLADRLPRHMIPSSVMVLDEIPTTPIGKVDHRALPAPADMSGASAAGADAPRGATERAVADLIAQRLGLDPAGIGRDDDFFDLGGNSLLATQIAGTLEQLTGRRVPVREVFDHPTVAGIARVAGDLSAGAAPDGVAAALTDADGHPLATLIHDPDAPVAPGPAQQQMWFLNRLDAETVGAGDVDATAGADAPDAAADRAQYTIAFALDLRGDLDVDALQTALRHTIERHEPLRTVYPDADGRPVIELRTAEQACPDLTPRPVAAADWAGEARALARSAFDLTRDVPVRAVLHRITDVTDGTDEAGAGGPVQHKLTLVIHHIAADGWSMAPMARDLERAYADVAAGHAPSQAPLPVTYRDYLRWQAGNLGVDAARGVDPRSLADASGDSRLAELTRWWSADLDGVDLAAPLLADHPTPAAEGAAGADVVEVTVDPALRAELVALSDGHATEFMTMHAVLAVLLHKLHADPDVQIGGAASDVVIGTPVAGRTDPRLAEMVGMFVNSVVLRTGVDPAATFAELLSSVREHDLEALSQSDMPFERVVAMLNPPRTARHPVFSIALAFDAAVSDRPVDAGVRLDGLDVDVQEVDTGAARFDLELRLRGDTLRFTYATDVFTRGRVAGIAEAFVRLAGALARDPHRPIGDHRIAELPAADSGTTAPAPMHLADMLERTVAAHPEMTAVDDGTATMTYRDLDAVSTHWARRLTSLGVGPEDVIAVALPRSLESIVATWAVAKAGAAVLPIDPRYPADRIEHMIDDSGAILGITTTTLIDPLPHRIWWLTVESLSSGEVTGVDDDRRAPLTPRDPSTAAYVIYTSGSTGTPKGVTVTHRGLAAFSTAQRETYDTEPGSRTLHFASPSFDAAMLEFLLAFDNGGTMVIAPDSIYGGDELVDFLDEAGVSHAFITPAALLAARPRELPQLRVLGVGGEANPPELIARWAPGRTYLNCYGPTETTIVATMSAPLRPGDPITIGHPIDGCTALVLDHRLAPVPDGVPGELYLTGPGLARGYLNRAGLSAARFVAAPTDPGTRMYRTGDIVHRTVDGSLMYHGRSDNQVKVRGFRIELDEVAAALSAHPAVDTATVLVRGTGASAALVGYVTVDADAPGHRPEGAELAAAAARRLPRHMVPSAVMVLDEIPLTRNGKLDRAALPAPAEARQGTAGPAADRPAAGTAGRAIAEIVADVLGLSVDDIGADDDFFLLGGTSLQATTLVSRINRQHTGTPLRVRDVFDHPTIAGLAGLAPLAPAAAGDDGSIDGGSIDGGSIDGDIVEGEIVSDETVRGEVAAAPRPNTVPLAPVQRRLWSIAQASPASTEYLMPFALRLDGPLDIAALRNALVDIVSRHTSLRSVYPLRDGAPVAVVLDDPEAVVGDLTPVPTADVDAAMSEVCAVPIDVTAQAPLRAHLLRAASAGNGAARDGHVLVLVVHHIAADGASLPVVVGDLVTAYQERVGGRTTPWSPAAVDYRDFALATAHADTDPGTGGTDLDYWVTALAGAPAQTLPAAAREPDADVTDPRAAVVTAALDDELRDAVNRWARTYSTSAFTVLHTALAVLLHRLGAGDGGHDLVIGTPVANRWVSRPGAAADGAEHDFERVVGMFVNTLALRTRLSAADSVADLIDRVRDADLDALDHAGTPFDDVVSAINPEREPGYHPLFQVALSVHDFGDGLTGTGIDVTDGLRGRVAEAGPADTGAAAKFDLQFTVTGMNARAAGGAEVELTYAVRRYGRADATDLLTRFLRVVRAIVTDPHRAAGDVRITDPLEVADVGPAAGPVPATPMTFGALLDDAVRRNPDGVAAVDAHGSITYRELDERANRLARVLLGRGVGTTGDHRPGEPEQVVAMAVGRSVEALVAIWAIIRSGAAYVPIDPTYPADRIEHMLTDSGARLAVTTTEVAARLPGEIPAVLLDDPGVRVRLSHSSPSPITDTERVPARVHQLAYVIYTSGSTGRPKGVLVPHSGLRAVHDELRSRMRPDHSSRVLHFASPSFDASVLEFLLAAAGAATLVIAPTDIYGGAPLARFIADHGVTHAFITPAAVASMEPADVPSLTALAIGGEAFGSDLAQRWSHGRTLLNVYGPTETTVITTGDDLGTAPEVAIGTPNNGVGALVLDERLHPVPAGVTGELYLLGTQVTRGYHRRPGLTATRFVPAPMVTGWRYAGDRMYRTGDLVRWTTDGRLVYVGRGDNQVQVRGFRIELGEIDDALTAEADVDFAVTVVADGPGGPRLHSYVTTSTGHQADRDRAGRERPGTDHLNPDDLRSRVARRLPRHMVPTAITVLDEIPLTPVGKLDRSALPAPASSAGDRGRAPRPGLESTVAEAIASVLDIPVGSVGADDGFFDLGGNSLLAAALTSSLSERLGRDITAQIVFGAPSPAEMAAQLGDSGTDTVADGATGDPAGAVGGSTGFAPVLTLRRPGGDPDMPAHPPLFVVHPAIGLSWSFASLLPHLPPDRAVYGLQNPALSGAPEASTIEELAADYVARIREIQPEGPYHLLGWSLGGLIAQEMAVQLTAAGQEVGPLVLLDSYVVANRPDLDIEPSLGGLLEEFGIQAAAADGEEPTADEAWAAVRAIPGPLAGISRADFDRINRAFRQSSRLAEGWFPRAYHGDAVFVSATVDRPAGPPALDSWARYLRGRVRDVPVEASHARMLLSENVTGFAAVLDPLAAAR